MAGLLDSIQGTNAGGQNFQTFSSAFSYCGSGSPEDSSERNYFPLDFTQGFEVPGLEIFQFLL